jgi:hypothetical protein
MIGHGTSARNEAIALNRREKSLALGGSQTTSYQLKMESWGGDKTWNIKQSDNRLTLVAARFTSGTGHVSLYGDKDMGI